MADLSTLEEVWRQARGGSTAVVLLSGAAGSGKTHLLRRVTRQHAGQVMQVHGRAWLPRMLSAHHAFFRQERQLDFVSAARQVAPQVQWPHLGASTGLKTEEQLWVPLLAGLERLIRRLGGVILALDAVEEFTPDDWRVVTLLHRRFAASQVPCLLLLSGVTAALPVVTELRQQSEQLRVPLWELVMQPLAEDGVRELVQENTGRGAVPAELIEWLLKHGEGQPLHTQQIMQLLRAEGYLREVGATWAFQPPAAHHWPDSLEKLFLQRLQGLSTLEREALGALAVFQVPLNLATWSELTELDEMTLRRMATQAQVRKLVQVSGTDGHSLYALQHASFGPLLLAETTEEQRRTWHARSVEVTSGVAQAEHAHAAADARAPHLIGVAIQQASGQRQFSEVVQLGQLLLPRSLPDDLRGSLAQAYFHTGATKRALQLAAGLDTPLGRLVRYEATLRLGHGEDTLKEILAAERHPQEDAATWRVRRWICLMQLGRAEEARTELEAILPGLTGLARAQALDALSDLRYDLGDLRGSLEVGREAIKALRAEKDLFTLAVTLSNFGGTSGHFGQWQEGIAALREALELQSQLGHLAYRMYTISNLGFLHLCAGQYHEAETHLHEAVRLAHVRQDERVLAAAHTTLTELLLRQGEVAAARQAFDQARALPVRETATPHDEAELLVFEGQAQAACQALPQEPGVLHQADPAPQVALVYLACQQPQQALQVLRDAWKPEDHVVRQALMRYLMAAALRETAPEEALTALQEAQQQARLAQHQPLHLELTLALDRLRPHLSHAEQQHLQAELEALKAKGHLLRLNLTFPAQQPSPGVPVPAPRPALLLTLGTFRCLDDQGNESLRGSKPRALLALLLCASLNARQGLPRQELLATLWPDTEPVQAEQTFRATLKRLRAGLGRAATISQQRGLYQLTDLHSDVTYFLEALERHDFPAATGWYQGDFLPGLDLPEVDELRANLRQRYRGMVLHYHLEHPPELAVTLLESVLRRDPLDLEALRVTAHLLAQLGWHQRQQQLIQRSRRAFLDELGELPPDWLQWFTSGSPSV